jgi:hypothetical protein
MPNIYRGEIQKNRQRHSLSNNKPTAPHLPSRIPFFAIVALAARKSKPL